MVYPGTEMEQYCKDHNIELNNECSGDTNNAVGSIKFSPDVTRKLRNICKLATLIVKYMVPEDWARALIEIDYDSSTSEKLSMARYRECVVDRLGQTGERVFDEILATMKLRF